MPRLFGTDGVRGVANRDLTPDLAVALGRADRISARVEARTVRNGGRDALDALERVDGAGDLLLEARAERAAGDGERQLDRHVAAVHDDLAHHVELRDGPPELGVDHPPERGHDLPAIRLHCRERSNQAPTSSFSRSPFRIA